MSDENEKPKVAISGQDGNSIAIMATVRKVLRQQGRLAEWPDAQKRMLSGDYGNVLTVAEEYVEFE